MGNGEGWFQIPSVKAGLHGSDSEPQFFIFFNVPDLMTAVARVKELGGETDGTRRTWLRTFLYLPRSSRYSLRSTPAAQRLTAGSHSPSQQIVSLNLCCPCVSSYIFYHSVATVPKIQTCLTYRSRRWMATEMS